VERHGQATALTLSPLERAAGAVLGEQPGAEPLAPAAHPHPREALADAVLAGLRRPPCLVSFSGGRDSSAVLAVAADAARRRGLPLPVPVSLRFPAVATTAETEWQELVIRHLGLADWERIELQDELDFLGPLARAGLSRHGLLWPANAHFHSPVFARAAGGSVLTGVDGDGLLGWRWGRLRAGLSGPQPPRLRAVLRAGLAMMPAPVRARRSRRRPPAHGPWLRPEAARELQARAAADQASEPIRWDRRVDWFARRRYLHVGLHSLELLAADHDARLVHPLADRAVLAALRAHGARAGYGTRNRAMAALFGDLLPPALITRPSKAEFGRSLWGPQARAFAERWAGGGVDSELVDGEALSAAWAQENPPLAAASVMQAAWLEGAHGPSDDCY
jgi:asparagine synthase (glutamine-hydrolysing)